MSGYEVAHLDEIDELTDGRCPYRPVRHHFGISSFGITAWTGRDAGDRILNEHDEADGSDVSEELYLVQSGRARFELDGESVDAPAGTFVSVPPAVKRTAFAEEPGTTVVAVGGVAGKAYEPVGWELWMPLSRQYEAGENEAVYERLREIVDANPQYALLAYNLACLESLTGRTDEALEHLRRSIEMSERFRDYAQGDSDLDAIRNEPAFVERVGSARA
jgi:tetratricopeptide (TPR) repeat protein